MITAIKAIEFLNELRSKNLSGALLRKAAMQGLFELPGYDWCGVYRLEKDTLVLDEYVGEETDHTHIKVGVGVCGTAVAEDENQVIADVTKIENYLSCSLSTRSEIVVLIRDGSIVLGQIDIDGHAVGAFDYSDEKFLQDLADFLSDNWA